MTGTTVTNVMDLQIILLEGAVADDALVNSDEIPQELSRR